LQINDCWISEYSSELFCNHTLTHSSDDYDYDYDEEGLSDGAFIAIIILVRGKLNQPPVPQAIHMTCGVHRI
jgi:hypothetical protein